MQGQLIKIPTYQLPQKRQQWQAKSEVKQGFICFNCQNEGHMAKDCNMLTRYGNCKRNGYTWKECPSIKCAKCGEKGHVAGNCHSEKINWLEDTVEPLQILKRRTTQALKAYIKLKGTPLPVLLDTGASVSAISKDLAQKLQLKVEANDGTRVSPLGGNPKVKVIGLV